MQLSVIVATLEGCSFAQLNDANRAVHALREAVAAGGFTLLHHYVHPFSPQGITATAVLAESHINLHSWPEDGLLFVDMATCSGSDATQRAFSKICELYPHQRVSKREHELHGPKAAAPVVAPPGAARPRLA